MTRVLHGIALVVVLASRVTAQAPVSGVAVDARSKRGLPCVEVALLDSTGAVRATTRTGRSGAFQFAQAPRDALRLRFAAQGLLPFETVVMATQGSGVAAHRYLVTLTARMTERGAPPEEFSPGYVPLSPIPGLRSPAYPDELRSSGQGGTAVIAFAVDDSGRVDRRAVFDLYSSHPAARRAVTDVLRYQRFQPALEHGHAICAFVVLRNVFA